MFLSNFLFKKSLFAALFLTLAAGFTFAQNTAELLPKERLDVFDKVWEKINKKYYAADLNGVDWQAVRGKYQPQIEAVRTDREFYAVLKEMVGRMNDSHTRFLTPREAQEFKNQQGTGVGLRLGEVEGKTMVLQVLKDSPADRAGVKAGMTVRTIDGKPAAELMAEIAKDIGGSSSERAQKILANRRLLEGEPETSIAVGLTDIEGKNFEVQLIRKTNAQEPKPVARRLNSGIGYISLNTFRGNAFAVFKTEFEKIKDAPALIIDLRYNGGGSIAEVLEIAGLFEKKGTSFGKMFSRSQKTTTISAGGNDKNLYSAPVVILINASSASGSELFASGLQEAGRAVIVGSQSCGCLLGITEERELKGGGTLQLSEVGFTSANNKVYEKIGVTPDRIIPVTIQNLQTPVDEDLTEAENYLKSRLNKK